MRRQVHDENYRNTPATPTYKSRISGKFLNELVLRILSIFLQEHRVNTGWFPKSRGKALHPMNTDKLVFFRTLFLKWNPQTAWDPWAHLSRLQGWVHFHSHLEMSQAFSLHGHLTAGQKWYGIKPQLRNSASVENIYHPHLFQEASGTG